MTVYKVAFLGMGIMGAPMAGHIAAAGHTVRVYNRSKEKAEAWCERYSGSVASSVAEAVADADFVMACLGDDDSVYHSTLGDEGAFASMKDDAVFVDHTTASAELAYRLSAEAKEHGVHFLDAPVSGGQVGAENGALTVMVGGDQPVFDRAVPIIQCYAKAVTLLGKSGAGQLCKMVNQICIAGLVQGLAEAVAFSQKAGLDSKQVISVISKGAAQSWQMENRGETMVDGEFEFGFAVDHMRKDLGLCLNEARRNGAHLPVAALVDQFYSEVQQQGGNRWDTSSLLTLLK